MTSEELLIQSIKQYCLSDSYSDDFKISFSIGLETAKSIILEKIERYEYENKK